jgi:hypothetical protein
MRSPCHTCKGRRKPTYPDCSDDCQEVNAYLVSIGDRPTVKAPGVDLKLFKTDTRGYLGGYKLCSEEQYKVASAKVLRVQKELDMTSAEVAKYFNISKDLVHSIKRGTQKKMGVHLYELILGREG